MADHRVFLKINFSMHGHKAEIDQCVSWGPDYTETIHQWLDV